MPLTEVKVEIAAASADAAETRLLEDGEAAWSVLEDAVARRAWLVGIFPDRATAETAWTRLADGPGRAALGGPAWRTLADEEWRDSYKAHFHAWQFGALHWVPIWEKQNYPVPAGQAVLWLDPGLAFGTGNHETTRLCCERLSALAAAPRSAAAGPRRVIDAGCGSGILALSAVRLGLGPVLAFDLDPDAVRISRENAALNGLDGQVDFWVDDLAGGLRGRRAEIVLANIQADVLCRHAAELAGAVAPGGTLVLSGILATELSAVRAAFSPATVGWGAESRTLGEWSDLALRLPG
jgi:ribosomal protein L11 methyltransferase